MLTATRAIAFPRLTAAVSIRGNQLRGHATMVPLNQCGLVDDCLFAENRCEVIGQVEKEPITGEISARTINASNNRLIAPAERETLHLYPQIEKAIVMGNTSTGKIVVVGGMAVPDPIDLTNIMDA